MSRFRVAVAGCLSALLVAAFTLASVESGAAAPASKPAEYIVVLKNSANTAKAETRHEKAGAQIGHRYSRALKGYAATMPSGLVAKVKADPDVLFVTPSRRFRPPPNPRVVKRLAKLNPQGTDREIRRVDGHLSSTRSGDGTGNVDVDIAVIDTGVDPRQLELHVAGGYNCVGNNRNDWGPTETGDVVEDGHGTFVAGLIGALDDNAGIVGIAPGARIWSLRVFGPDEFGTDADLICALDWVAATRLDGDPRNDIEIANMSLGDPEKPDDGNCGRTNGDPVHLASCRIAELGVTPVASAGNEAHDATTHGPSGYDEVLGATAMADYDGLGGSQAPAQCVLFNGDVYDDGADFGQIDDGAAYFSNWVSLPSDQAHTLSAPGVCMISLAPRKACGERYPSCYQVLGYGTSYAAPIVAGVVALCIASGPCAGLTPAQIITKIVADAHAYNVAHPDYGFVGDPQHPIAGKYYGDLVRAALY